jgi:CD109 antigen
MRVVEGDKVTWKTDSASFMGASGDTGSIETTALATIALLRSGAHPDASAGALATLIQSKDSWGTWYTTQATILSLKALLLSTAQSGQVAGPVTLAVSLNNELTQQVVISETNADVVHVVTFDRGFSPSGANRVQIELQGADEGDLNLMYQVSTRYYLPWDKVAPQELASDLMTIDVQYDRTQLAVDDEVRVDAGVKLNQPGTVKMVLIDLGLPPGFSVKAEDLGQLVETGAIARYELTGRQIIIYLEDFSSERPLEFSYRLVARFPLRAQAPASSAYDYYNPADSAVRAPLELTVIEK